MPGDYDEKPMKQKEVEALKKKIHRALVEARNARYHGDEAEVRQIINRMMAEAAPAAYKASKEGAFNWVVEALKPLDEMLLPDDE
ncbi:MAG: hypothetical protein K0B84_08295 [Firmicutes bacterium]|nr:hypothetical protein [Bacillota bacterium]